MMYEVTFKTLLVQSVLRVCVFLGERGKWDNS